MFQLLSNVTMEIMQILMDAPLLALLKQTHSVIQASRNALYVGIQKSRLQKTVMTAMFKMETDVQMIAKSRTGLNALTVLQNAHQCVETQ